MKWVLLFANAFPPKALAKVEKCERYPGGSGQIQRTAGSAAKASLNASITPTSSDSMAVLTFGTVINLSPIFYVGGNVLKFYPNVEGKTITLLEELTSNNTASRYHTCFG
jgi:hypothetical protein